MVPHPQPFQHTLPDSPETLPDYVPVAEAIEDYMEDDSEDMKMFIQLALNCASTFRATDYRGGCNEQRYVSHLNLSGSPMLPLLIIFLTSSRSSLTEALMM